MTNIMWSISNWFQSHTWIWTTICGVVAIPSLWVAINKRKKAKYEANKHIGDVNGGTVNKAGGNIYGDEMTVSHVSDKAVINQAGGDVSIINNYGMRPEDIIPMMQGLVKRELEDCQLQAEQTVTARFNEFSTAFETRLTDKVVNLIYRLAEPAVQLALRDAILGYIKYADPDKKDDLVDVLIERIKVVDHTTRQFLIDDAIKILPNLSENSLAILTLLTHSVLRFSGKRNDLDNWIKCINPFLDILPQVDKLDMEYLVQTNCVSSTRVMSKRDLAEESLNNYPLAFCAPINEADSKKFMTKYCIIRQGASIESPSNPKVASVLSQIFDFNEDDTITPTLLKAETYKKVLQENKLEAMILDIETLLSCGEKASNEDVVAYYNGLNPNWSMFMKMLKERPLNKYELNPAGKYIASRQLIKLSGLDVYSGGYPFTDSGDIRSLCCW